MKYLTLLAIAGACMLGGCETTGTNDPKLAQAEESFTPIGTAIPRKTANAAERPTAVNKQALENDRAMGAANRDGR